MNWTNLLTQGASLCSVLYFIWKGSRVIKESLRTHTEAIKNAAKSQERSQAKSDAEKARFETLWSLVEIQGELIEEIHDFLAKSPEDREKAEFRIRNTTKKLHKKASDRLASHHTDFT